MEMGTKETYDFNMIRKWNIWIKWLMKYKIERTGGLCVSPGIWGLLEVDGGATA